MSYHQPQDWLVTRVGDEETERVRSICSAQATMVAAKRTGKDGLFVVRPVGYNWQDVIRVEQVDGKWRAEQWAA